MSDYKEQYMRAIKALGEAEKEGADNVESLYLVLMSILAELKGQHKSVDKAISALPRKLSKNRTVPIDELARVKDLIVSYVNTGDDIGAAPNVLETLLSNLKVSDSFQEGAEALQQSLAQARSSKDFVTIAREVASLVLKNTPVSSPSLSGGSIADIKQGLLFQLEKLGKSDAELARSIDIPSLVNSLNKVNSLRDLEVFYKQVFEGLGQRISKKDEFIVELSGLIETVVHQLSELSADLKKEGVENAEITQDRWRLTELMGGQINTLQDSVLQTDSLSTLKTMLAEGLGELNQTVSEFAEMEEGRAKQAEERALSVTNRLKRVESEASDLKHSLHQAHEQAFVDPLTGVANRRAYDGRIKLEFERWKRNREPLVLAVLDIDRFKGINDEYGHAVGDKVLRTISQLVDKKVRDSDFFGRVGGEEFAIIFTGSDLDNAVKRLNHFRESVAGCKFGYKGKRIVITMSVGCALFAEGDTPDSVFERADQALYKAKQTGRNKCLSELDL